VLLWWKQWLTRAPRKNQAQIARRADEVVAKVIHEAGIGTLVTGTLVLDKSCRLRFLGASFRVDQGAIAAVQVGQLAEADVLRALNGSAAPDPATLAASIEALIAAVMREFHRQSRTFRALG
jgi:hypothetical protein